MFTVSDALLKSKATAISDTFWIIHRVRLHVEAAPRLAKVENSWAVTDYWAN